jgi:hypothetical protein
MAGGSRREQKNLSAGSIQFDSAHRAYSIGRLDLLRQLRNRICIPPAVAREVEPTVSKLNARLGPSPGGVASTPLIGSSPMLESNSEDPGNRREVARIRFCTSLVPKSAFTRSDRSVRILAAHLRHSAGAVPLPSMIALMVPSGRTRPRWCATMTALRWLDSATSDDFRIVRGFDPFAKHLGLRVAV